MNIKSVYPIIVCEDLDKAVKFYTETMNFRVKHDVTRKDGGHVVVVTNDKELEFELMSKLTGGPFEMKSGLYGLRMNVDDLEAAKAEFEAGGGKVVAGPIPTPSGTNYIVEDPDGVRITLIEHNKK